MSASACTLKLTASRLHSASSKETRRIDNAASCALSLSLIHFPGLLVAGVAGLGLGGALLSQKYT